jgi:hypothetical protein
MEKMRSVWQDIKDIWLDRQGDEKIWTVGFFVTLLMCGIFWLADS